MTSISAASVQSCQSPLQKLQDALLSEVKSGAIKSSDQDALASALTDIDSAMQAGRASDQASGKLTSDQATELQGIFKAAFANGPGGAGRGGPRLALLRAADKATQQPSFPKGKDGCLIFSGRNRAAVVTLVSMQDVWRVQWQATS
jgi:hypothetical protein